MGGSWTLSHEYAMEYTDFRDTVHLKFIIGNVINQCSLNKLNLFRSQNFDVGW